MAHSAGSRPQAAPQKQQLEQTRPEAMWAAILLNDDYTPFDWVQEILTRIFERTPAEALAITQAVHTQGRGVGGVYPRVKAVRLCFLANRLSREAGHPFTCRAVPLAKTDGEL